ncbi:MAG: LEA type 2 family protein [gamma proteobacterium symbiont of Bathyaustriella thionipta]|nr:LEA type 2 family protein [gamma proteobacterium symbiont of Bathyaustriella thionipta]
MNTRLLSCWFFSLLLLGGCATMTDYETPRVSVVNIHPIDFQLLEQQFAVTLRIQNPNQAALDIDGMSYELEINGIEMAHGVHSEDISVGGFSEQVIEVRMVGTTFALIRQFQYMQKQQGKPVTYRLSGRISTLGGFNRVPFEYKGEIDLSSMTTNRAPAPAAKPSGQEY